MSNPQGEISLRIGKRERTLNFAFGEFKALDRVFAKTHGSLLLALQNQAMFDVATQAVVIGCRKDKVTETKVDRWFEELDAEEPGSASKAAQFIVVELVKIMNPGTNIEEDEDGDEGNDENEGSQDQY